MKHLGDVTKIDGGGAPVVNVIIGGSPCQDLSVAGKTGGTCIWASEIEEFPIAVTKYHFPDVEKDE